MKSTRHKKANARWLRMTTRQKRAARARKWLRRRK